MLRRRTPQSAGPVTAEPSIDRPPGATAPLGGQATLGNAAMQEQLLGQPRQEGGGGLLGERQQASAGWMSRFEEPEMVEALQETLSDRLGTLADSVDLCVDVYDADYKAVLGEIPPGLLDLDEALGVIENGLLLFAIVKLSSTWERSDRAFQKAYETATPEDAVVAAREMGALFGRFGDVGAASGLIGFDISFLTDNIAEFMAIAARDILSNVTQGRDLTCAPTYNPDSPFCGP